MRKLMVLLGLSSAFAATPAFATAPSDPGQPGFIQFCKGDVAGDPRFHLGDCASFIATLQHDSPGFVPQLCDLARVVTPDAFNSAYDSYDECVRDGASQIPF
jgi:hypothetical protein